MSSLLTSSFNPCWYSALNCYVLYRTGKSKRCWTRQYSRLLITTLRFSWSSTQCFLLCNSFYQEIRFSSSFPSVCAVLICFFLCLFFQAPVDNGSKITSYLLEWDEVLIFVLVHKKGFIKVFIITIQFLFTFLVKAFCMNCISTFWTLMMSFLTPVLFTFTLFKYSYLSDVSASFTDHSTLLPLIHFSPQPSLQKLNGFSDFMQCSDGNVC